MKQHIQCRHLIGQAVGAERRRDVIPTVLLPCPFSPLVGSQAGRTGGRRAQTENPNVFHETQSCARLRKVPGPPGPLPLMLGEPGRGLPDFANDRARRFREAPPPSHLIRRSQRAHSITKRRRRPRGGQCKIPSHTFASAPRWSMPYKECLLGKFLPLFDTHFAGLHKSSYLTTLHCFWI